MTQKELKKLEYADALEKLLEELCENKVKFDEFSINVNLRFKELEEDKKWNWITKLDSYTNWASGNNFQYKYFSTNAYFNFVNQGHILNTEYLSIPKGNIANTYELFHNFNIELQNCENMIYRIDVSSNNNIERIKSIQECLLTYFYNKYSKEHLNGGFYSNYEKIYENLYVYFDFNKFLKKYQKKYKEQRQAEEENRKNIEWSGI